MSTSSLDGQHRGVGLDIGPSPAESPRPDHALEDPFADPISPSPAHFSPRSKPCVRQDYFAREGQLQRTEPGTIPWSGSSASGYTASSEGAQARVALDECRPVIAGLVPGADGKRNGLSSRIKHKISSQIDPRSILELMDFRPWFWPITPKKYFTLFLVACAVAGVVVSDVYFDWISKSLAITRSFLLPVLILSVCAEPIMMLLILPVAKIPDIPQSEIDIIMREHSNPDVEAQETAAEKQSDGPSETALVIPCHNTDLGAIKKTLDSAFLGFRPRDIFIVDNGKSQYPKHPTCNFRAYIRSIHPDIVYIWSPIGSKNAAQFVGALAAKGYKYIMTVDDDVCISRNFRAPTEMINEKFKAVSYPLKSIDANHNVPLFLVAWQDVEYRLAGLAKMAEDRLCGVQYPHGAGWFVERESFITLLEYHHPMDFIAEDCNAGLGLNAMGKGIHCDARSFLATEVPTTFLGPGLNWWKQRQKSWEMGRHGRTFAFIRQLLFVLLAKSTPQDIFWHKITYLYLLCTNTLDWLRIPIFIAFGKTASWWRNAILLMLFSAVPALIYKYIKCHRRPDLQPRFWACLTYPWYKQIHAAVSILGAARTVGYYFGGHKRPFTIQQMIKTGENCFWLDERFDTNPAFLADEAEAQATAQSGAETADSPTGGNTSGTTNPEDLRTAILDPLSPSYQVRGLDFDHLDTTAAGGPGLDIAPEHRRYSSNG